MRAREWKIPIVSLEWVALEEMTCSRLGTVIGRYVHCACLTMIKIRTIHARKPHSAEIRILW